MSNINPLGIDNTTGQQRQDSPADTLLIPVEVSCPGNGVSCERFGAGTLVASSGNNNTAVGSLALRFNTTGAANTAVGSGALNATLTGNGNTAIGVNTLQGVLVGNTGATAVGVGALQNTTGVGNTAIGTSSLNQNTSGTDNTAAGFNALSSSTGNGNSAVGSGAGFSPGVISLIEIQLVLIILI